MELIRGIHNIRLHHQKCVLTIGNFDGVHRGHQAILSRVRFLACKYKVPSCIMIFEPQPREFFSSEKAPGRISRLRDKVRLLEGQGIDYVLIMPFNKKLQQLTAQSFCRSILTDGLKVRHLVVGDDFRFGCDRQGDFNYLNQFGMEHGFVVENTMSVVTRNQERVSSSLIRELLQKGDIDQAEAALGHPVELSGRVVHGKQLGRTLGFPTANVHLKMTKPALNGVYAVVFVHNGIEYPSVANIGTRPTVNGVLTILEVNIFDFNGDLYDEYVKVRFCEFIREERKMSGLEELESQIQLDKEKAQHYFINQ
ncbi:bifunctional riboflavin kinase/FAD synthetase [Marinomonas sp. 15G1-11]|uniref:Riboflavin biosynthesis protein n=1 Tax=Marinomonas phaeophyticola TaxID=3004091 RepID=A0ABT4JVR8_9GAMM|nr:bifunctional riboflavin kinase/FAD synthetase [Marinomonas sp. 15G1-11]MCZ2722467.1 bifunctional riboflavin kinase/FAD synthetase [Marinomonas sp. 15G1-11]